MIYVYIMYKRNFVVLDYETSIVCAFIGHWYFYICF